MDRLELLRGDIVEQDVDAIVNAANSDLLEGAGVCGAIHAAAGPGLARECDAAAPCPVGDARLTGGHELPARFVIHAVGPVYTEDPDGAPARLRSAFRASLAIAEERGLDSIAFPAISTGVYGYPMREAADVALAAIDEWQAEHERPRLVRVVLFDDDDLRLWREARAVRKSHEGGR